MSSIVIMGSQWGDEGKGKMTDWLAQKADMIVRYQGGNNAGHTIAFNGKTYKLQLIPSGIFEPQKINVIGNGVVVNPKALLGELQMLKDAGVTPSNLKISSRAHLILPYHIQLDIAQEKQRGDRKVGTTHNGIGPAYMDKAARIGIRMCDLLEKDTFAAKLKENLAQKNALFEKIYDEEPFDFDSLFDEYYEYGQQLKDYVTDTSVLVNEAINAGKNVLFEGAQGIMLDLDHGTYPYVTSSNPVVGGALAGAGVGPQSLTKMVGVCKAYSTRVGEGPFPTELTNETGDWIREKAHEYGTVTGRPRRIGWFDAVAMRHAKRVSGMNCLSLNLLDIFTGLKKVKICTAYMLDGKQIDYYPASLKELERCEPVYEKFDGWTEDISTVTEYDQLPANAKKYLKRIEELTGLQLMTISVGPSREQTITLKDAWEDR
ncbi:adenylosuccinate synthase [Ligilactobacillus aviarius]|uniref:Adenylosuccinate synthetase n=1 Tax=Ligilactobacillus aviarius TaxID=1606 RepID=A0A510WSG8_9LACO|nr:adenylosuccinate synthase [Ligilactobacillus aviarius]KRM39285.1 adenylosuccinate synthase [Ligilactobacillus aviarius subsp. aviarius DSM 20655]GEK42173.1 adenylosuccinate synthetase [Ligilactobacillus aviarius]